MSSRKFPATMAVAAVTALGVFAVTGQAQASTGISQKHVAVGARAAGVTLHGKSPAVAAAPDAAAANPAGYTVVNSGALTSGANVQTHGSVACPSGKVPLGGGVFYSSGSVLANINSSYPTATGWAADVNNGSTSASSFTVYAVCAKKPKKYALITGTSAVVNAGTQVSNITATCPAGRAMSGGLFSNTSSVLANVNSSLPTKTGWRIDANNASASAETVTAYLLCGNLAKYHFVTGTATTNNAGVQTGSTTLCGHGVSVGGGAFSSSGSTLVSINTTYPNSTGSWETFMNNDSTAAQTFETYAVCSG